MKVKALKPGTWPHDRLRDRDEVFDYDGPTSIERDGKKVPYFPSWLQKLEEPKAEKPNKAETAKAETKQ